jgi:oligosaccharide 4-alpha-D-glucosyltransferase
MRQLASLLVLLVMVFSAGAQPKTFPAPLGAFTVEDFGPGVLRVHFQPKHKFPGEAISDAVVARRSGRKVPSDITSIAGALVIPSAEGNILIDYHERNGRHGFTFALEEGEKIFGGGERALPLDRRGYRLNLYNNPRYGYGEGADNLNYSVPFITSSHGYGLFFDNPARGYLDIGKESHGILEYGTASGALTVYVLIGDYAQVLQSYHRLTGTQPLPPRWAFGNLMSRFGYTSEAQVTDILRKMQDESIPVDAIIFDLFWFGDSIKGTMGNLDWVNPAKWPNPKQMIGNFRKQGINTLLVTEPYFVETSRNYGASRPYLAVDSLRQPYRLTDFYFGNGGLLDIFRTDAQAWFWQFYKRQMTLGVEAWWGDLGEPERHPANLYHNLKDLGQKRLFSADEVHNLYGHTWTKMLAGFYAKEYPGKRLFSLNRSGFAGTQRYSIFPWTGDVSRSWTGLRAQLPVLLGMSMSGVPYVHSDAGGFAGGEGDRELYIRWLQLAAFTPIFRPHGTALYDVDPGAFSFPSEAALIDTPYREMARRVIGLRYQMLPYNYTLAYEQARSGKPLIAPLYYHYPTDTAAVSTGNEYMWGESILVAPILEKGATERPVYLPAGDWYSFNTNRLVTGNTTITDTAQLGQMPLYVKAGSFLPLWSPGGQAAVSNTGGYDTSNRLTIRYFPSATKTTYTLFEDDGADSRSIAQSKYRLLAFTGVRVGNRLTITIRSAGPQPASKKRRFLIQVPGHLAYPVHASKNGRALGDESRVVTSYAWNPQIQYEGIEIEFDGKPLTLQIDIKD